MRNAVKYLVLVVGVAGLQFFLWSGIGLSAHEGHWQAPESAKALKNPVAVDAKSLAAGKELYAKYCTMCHGDTGKGDGAMAAGLPEPPADLSLVLVKESDGEIFWKVSTGKNPMPAFSKKLSKDEIWTAVIYTKTLVTPAKPK